jgi:hypothetical protein
MALREDRIDPRAVVPANFVWHGVCGRCQQTVMFESVGTKRAVSAEAPPLDDMRTT